ncbi:hypothetical protein H7U35_10965 [Mediterranea massiliensis]|uniref:DUF2178 domain-containing protein n=1 Tax=Mediterranea massiliensis TaxID=1841865 RepID=A0ABS2E270_9BACT|nr:hypothetical protein [Mediterranea massiliensis]MBM6735732.1 hypothetical protein [Mediterranea massiliensis]
MKTDYLLSPSCKKVGLWLGIPFVLGGLYLLSNGSWMDTFLSQIGMRDCFDELVVIGLAVSLLLASFSREKDEDECIAHLRMQAWTMAVVSNYLILIVVTLCIYGMSYLNFMAVNMFTVLILFLVVFHWKLWRFRKENHE